MNRDWSNGFVHSIQSLLANADFVAKEGKARRLRFALAFEQRAFHLSGVGVKVAALGQRPALVKVKPVERLGLGDLDWVAQGDGERSLADFVHHFCCFLENISLLKRTLKLFFVHFFRYHF